MSDPPENWMTVGLDRLVKKAKSMYKERSSYDGGNLLGKELISFVTNSSSIFHLYFSPGYIDLI